MIVINRSRSHQRMRRLAKPTDPTPEMIRELTASIRAGWSARDYQRRSICRNPFVVAQMPLEPRRKGFWAD